MRRWWFWAIIAVVAYVVLSSVWIGVRGLQAKNDLEAAQAQIGALKDQALALDIDAASATLAQISTHTERAAANTSDIVWRIAEIVPFLGPNLTAVREIAEITDDMMSGVAVPLLSVAAAVDPASFAPKDGALDLSPFSAAIPAVARANETMIAAVDKADSMPEQWIVGPVADARTKIADMLAEFAPTIATLDVVVPLLPPAMGADGPRNYVLVFQNPAEPRALGGAALSFTLIQVDQGKISLLETKAASTGAFSRYPESVIPIPDGAQDVYPYGEFGTFIPEATARPSFTTAGEIIHEMWQREFGQSIDGVLSVDPVALSYLLRATGPISTPTGDVLDSTTLVPLLLNTIYLRYNSPNAVANNLAHDAVFAGVVGAVFGKLTTGPLDAKELLNALAQGWNERRVLFWSAHEDEQALMGEVGLNGELPISDEATVRAGLYLQDSVGSKNSFYLRQSVQLGSAQCFDDGRTYYKVQLDVSNTMDPSVAGTLPFHITGEWAKVGTQPGVNRMTIRLYAPPGSEIIGATLDGAQVALPAMHDTDYPVGKTVIEVAPGGAKSLIYYFALGGDQAREFEAQITPLVTPTAVEITALDCAAIPQS